MPVNTAAIKDLSTYDRDKTNGKKKRDDPAEKESARAISLAWGTSPRIRADFSMKARECTYSKV